MKSKHAIVKIRDINKLTPSEEKVFSLYHTGLSRKEIANVTGLKVSTVTTSLRSALNKVESEKLFSKMRDCA